MGTLYYAMSISHDVYIEDPTGSIAFSEPDEEVHRVANRQTRETARSCSTAVSMWSWRTT
jgi:succinylarginine dihydrolase